MSSSSGCGGRVSDDQTPDPGDNSPDPSVEVTPTPLSTPHEQETATPTSSPDGTGTPAVTETPIETNTPVPTGTPAESPVPTAEPTPTAAPTPFPTPIPPPPPPIYEGDWFSGVMLVSDTASGRISLNRMSDSAELWSYSLNIYQPQLCNTWSPCQAFEVNHVVFDDQDFVDLTFSAGNAQVSSFHRVPMATPERPVFSLTGFDFSQAPESGCTLPPEQTCAPGANLLPPQCMVQFAHGFQLVEDKPSQKFASMVIADSNNRILQADLSYTGGNFCGLVRWVLNGSNPEWEPSCPPNHVQVMEEGGIDYLGVTCRSLVNSTGKGNIELYRADDSSGKRSWRKVWFYPDQHASLTTLPYLNIPHHGAFVAHPAGGWSLIYAHSDGLGTDWGLGDRGTIGSAFTPSLEQMPNYVQDEFMADAAGNLMMGFIKEVEMLPNGRRLIVDSGSFQVKPVVPGSIHVIGPQRVHDNALMGSWSADYSQMNLQNVAGSLERTYSCGWVGLYDVDWIGPEAMGRTLRQVITFPQGSCPIQGYPRVTGDEENSSPL